MQTRKGWSTWCRSAMRWLRTAGVVRLTAGMAADLMSLFERDYEARDAAFMLVEEGR